MRKKSGWARLLPSMNIWKSSIRYKWMLLLFLFSLTPLIVMGTISYSISKSTINEKVTEYSEQLLRQTADNIDTRLGIYKDLMMQVVNNGEIIRMLRDLDKTSAVKSYDIDSLSLTTKLSTIIAINQDIQSISFISKDHYIKGIYRWKNRTPEEVSGFLSTLEEGSNFKWFPTRLNIYVDSLNSQSVNVFSLSKQIYKTSDDSPVGIIAVLDIRGEVLRELGSSSTNNNRDIQSFVIDGQGQIVSYGDNQMIGKNVKEVLGEQGYTQIVHSGLEESRFPLHEQGKKLIVNYKKLRTNDWIVVNVISESILYQDSDRLLRMIWIIAALCIVFSVVTAIFLANSISNPILKMIRLMRQVMSGDLTVRFRVRKHSDEFDILGNNFNYMVARIDELLKTVYEEQNQKRTAELKALQAQINPHFLYNTLDIIKWTALIQKANNAAEMVSLLSRLLRISLDKGKETVTIEEEIEHVQCYLGIQKFRFNYKIETNVYVEDAVRHLQTPKLILQPIVENAIMHAFSDSEQEGKIDITCTRGTDGGIRFLISDNGKGMDPAFARSLLRHHEPGEKTGGIGLANVDERIKLISGKAYGIDIVSEPEAGTMITIRLPYLE